MVKRASSEAPEQPPKRPRTETEETKADDSKPAAGGKDQGPKKQRKNKDVGRGEYFRNRTDRRGRNDAQKEKKRDGDLRGKKLGSVLTQTFTEEEIAQEDRKPKRKVAVLIGYSGTGYKGMQFNALEKTIEGDLFKAFVEAGAISKANADDPKKSAFVRCARTDKGVHAAGNVISLKLIIEDPDIVKKINEKLSPQIRVWGFERTISSFSCYALCDSRWYEYLLPTHCLLPPHPRSHMGKRLVEDAKEVGDYEEFAKRQEDVAGFWDAIDAEKIQPLLDNLNEDIRATVEKVLFGDEEKVDTESEAANEAQSAGVSSAPESTTAFATEAAESTKETAAVDGADFTDIDPEKEARLERKKAIEAALRELNGAYKQAKLAYRVNDTRLGRLKKVLEVYCGTNNFHNYTIQKGFKDASAKRHIKSFQVGVPFEKHGSQWVSVKVHGQSFMMHQIRKMVSMACLIVRSGTDSQLIPESFGPIRLSIPKAPALGLLLERPVFDTYNEKHAVRYEREAIDFAKYNKELEEFKQKEIYEKIWLDEEAHGEFLAFFRHIDTWKEDDFMFLTSKRLDAVSRKQRLGPGDKSRRKAVVDSDDEEVADS